MNGDGTACMEGYFVDGDFGLLSWIGKDGIAIGNSLVIHFRRL